MFADTLKTLRKTKGSMSQAELAKLLSVTQQAVGLWETGKTTPDYTTLKKIASLFQVSTDYLLGNEFIVKEERAGYTVNADEHDFVQACRKLSPDKRQAVLTLVKSMAEK